MHNRPFLGEQHWQLSDAMLNRQRKLLVQEYQALKRVTLVLVVMAFAFGVVVGYTVR